MLSITFQAERLNEFYIGLSQKFQKFSVRQEMGVEELSNKQWVNGRNKADPSRDSFLHYGPGLAISTMLPILAATLHCGGFRLLAMKIIGMNLWTILLVSSEKCPLANLGTTLLAITARQSCTLVFLI